MPIADTRRPLIAPRAGRRPSRTRVALVGVVAFAALVGAGGASGSADRDLQRALDALVAHPTGPPGAHALINTDGRVRTFPAGRVAGMGSPVPGSGMRMRIASVTKAFTAATALRLVQQGRLSLDDTVGRWLPRQPAAWHGVTLAQLLRHTGGVPDFGGSAAFATAVQASPAVAPSPEGLLEFVADQPLDFAPGTRFRYSNSGPILVGLMVEAATGRAFPSVLRTEVRDVARLPATALPAGTAIPRPRLSGYLREGTRAVDASTMVAFGGWAWASGGLVSTPSDLSRFVRRYAGGGLVRGPARAAQFRFTTGRSYPKGPGANSVGLGIFRYRTRCGTLYGHTGNVLGYTQFAASTADGRRSAVASMSTQVTPALMPAFRRVMERAACAALG